MIQSEALSTSAERLQLAVRARAGQRAGAGPAGKGGRADEGRKGEEGGVVAKGEMGKGVVRCRSSRGKLEQAGRSPLAQVPACLHELCDQLEVNKLLRSVEGTSILPLAVRSDCKLLLAQPTVQHFLQAAR